MVSIKNLPTLNELLVLFVCFFLFKVIADMFVNICAIINHTGKYC